MVSAERCEQGTEGKYQTTVGQQSTKAAEALAGAVDKVLQQNEDIIQGTAYFVAEVCTYYGPAVGVANNHGLKQFPR